MATSPTRGPTSRHVRGLDGLRGIAALSVLLFHVAVISTPETSSSGVGRLTVQLSHGLTLFFVLSGFLLSRPFIAWLLGDTGPPSISRFARNRFLRIYPAYLSALLLTSLVLGLARPPGGLGGSASDMVRLDPTALFMAATLVSNLVPIYIFTGLGVSWSLTTELTFYAVLPLAAFASCAVIRRRGAAQKLVWTLPAAFILTGIAAKSWHATEVPAGQRIREDTFAWSDNWTSVLSRSLIEQADLFGWGIVAALVLRLCSDGAARGLRLFCLPLAVLGTLSSLLLPGVDRFQTSLVGIACASILVWLTVAPGPSGRVARVLELRPVRYAGDVSYSIYLWHMPVLLWLQSRNVLAEDTPTGLLINSGMVVASTLIVASLSFHFVERPALSLKSKPRAKVSRVNRTT